MQLGPLNRRKTARQLERRRERMARRATGPKVARAPIQFAADTRPSTFSLRRHMPTADEMRALMTAAILLGSRRRRAR